MDQSKKVQFEVTVRYIVEISENLLARHRVAYREDVPDVDWSEDESVVNAIVEDYRAEGAHDDLVYGPLVRVIKLRKPTQP